MSKNSVLKTPIQTLQIFCENGGESDNKNTLPTSITVAERYIRVFRSRFAVRRHLCLAFFVRASRFAVRSHLCLAFHVRASRFALSHSRFVLSRSCFAVRSSWLVVRGGFGTGGGSIYHRLFLRRKCAEQSECPVRRVTVDGMF